MTALDTLNKERARLVRERFALMKTDARSKQVAALTTRIEAISEAIETLKARGAA